MSTKKRRLILAIIATDSTYSLAETTLGVVWRGKCLHCRRWLHIDIDGTPVSEATIEHIVPRNRGGSERLDNLGIACARCNHEKGRRHDARRRPSPRSEQVIGNLHDERLRRWRSN